MDRKRFETILSQYGYNPDAINMLWTAGNSEEVRNAPEKIRPADTLSDDDVRDIAAANNPVVFNFLALLNPSDRNPVIGLLLRTGKLMDIGLMPTAPMLGNGGGDSH